MIVRRDFNAGRLPHDSPPINVGWTLHKTGKTVNFVLDFLQCSGLEPDSRYEERNNYSLSIQTVSHVSIVWRNTWRNLNLAAAAAGLPRSRLTTSCVTFAPVLFLCILIHSVFSLSSISAIFQEIFSTVWFWVNIFSAVYFYFVSL